MAAGKNCICARPLQRGAGAGGSAGGPDGRVDPPQRTKNNMQFFQGRDAGVAGSCGRRLGAAAATTAASMLCMGSPAGAAAAEAAPPLRPCPASCRSRRAGRHLALRLTCTRTAGRPCGPLCRQGRAVVAPECTRTFVSPAPSGTSRPRTAAAPQPTMLSAGWLLASPRARQPGRGERASGAAGRMLVAGFLAFFLRLPGRRTRGRQAAEQARPRSPAHETPGPAGNAARSRRAAAAYGPALFPLLLARARLDLEWQAATGREPALIPPLPAPSRPPRPAEANNWGGRRAAAC